MSLKPSPIPPVPFKTARIARAAFPKGNLYVELRAEFGTLYDDQLFADLVPLCGRPVIRLRCDGATCRARLTRRACTSAHEARRPLMVRPQAYHEAIQAGVGSGLTQGGRHFDSQDTWPRSRPMPVMPCGVVFRMSDPTASMVARVAPRRPLINNFLHECRSEHSLIDILMGEHK